MGILANLLAPRAEAGKAPWDDFWYQPAGVASSTGINVSADIAMRVSAVWACTRLLSETIASLPLSIYKKRSDGGREEAAGHPIYRLLHYRPNDLQTSTEFIGMLTTHALLRGNGYARIVPGPRGPVDQLLPMHPDNVTPKLVEGVGVQYRVTNDDGTTDILTDGEVLHIRGMASKGVTGLSIIEHARETVGLALATESYGARLFSQDARPGGVLTVPGKLQQDSIDRLRSSWQAAHSGLKNAHQVAVLEQGTTFQSIAMSNEDAQFLGSREFGAEEIARWFGVPPHMIGLTSKSTSWGSGIEAQSINFLTYTLLPWLRRWEQAIGRDLILADDTYFAKFTVNGLLRGDSAARSSYYSIGRQWGYLNVNDIRGLEDMNPIGPEGDRYLEPLNMKGVGDPAPAPTPSSPPPANNGARAHHAMLVSDTASRIVHREIAAMSKAAVRCSSDPDGWANAIHEFYVDHASYVVRTLRIPHSAAAAYVEQQQAELIERGSISMIDWETRRADALVALAMEEMADG